ncbi:MAG: NlpC/P60 family protein [Corynebacterium sp.]|jgi:cell wall-associated NlpC family hydrolase|uniref:NlpC/P60 family protein n=1 Tax=unclassified Corynebacterium TaxID=2624378 RepID=UPI0009685B4D|nr:NlpC/P60 family protein [Corynebacterium sp. CNJ-954]OLT51467.1 endopeptidase [Corynebacterium sp. CNJ-954]
MGKHRMKKDHSRRNAVAVAAVGMGAVIALPATAQAVTVEVPNTDISVDVPNEAVDFAKQHVDVDPFLAAADQVSAPSLGGSDAVSAPNSVGQKIADAAMSKQGAPYSWGAAGPNAFDCSGLTSWAHQQVGKSIPRTSGEQAASGTPVSLDALQPGDVVSYYSGASHVAIYIGDGKVVQALNEGSPVQVNDLNYMPVNNAVRF